MPNPDKNLEFLIAFYTMGVKSPRKWVQMLGGMVWILLQIDMTVAKNMYRILYPAMGMGAGQKRTKENKTMCSVGTYLWILLQIDMTVAKNMYRILYPAMGMGAGQKRTKENKTMCSVGTYLTYYHTN